LTTKNIRFCHTAETDLLRLQTVQYFNSFLTEKPSLFMGFKLLTIAIRHFKHFRIW